MLEGVCDVTEDRIRVRVKWHHNGRDGSVQGVRVRVRVAGGRGKHRGGDEERVGEAREELV